MFVLTAKISKKKIFVAVATILVAVIALTLIFSGGTKKNTAAVTISSNEDLVRFLASFGWSIDVAPVQTQTVLIPREDSELFERYNALQQSQGYDLNAHRGDTATRYVYEILNYPEAEAPVYATVLVADSTIIGGDITGSGEGGLVHGFRALS